MTNFPKSVSTVVYLAAIVFVVFATTSQTQASDVDPVWRVEIEFSTADVGDASTDDKVQVRLNGNNLTKLDYARDDFERDTTFSYDLNLDGISTIADIERIEISKKGSDGWCIESFRFRINNVEAYHHVFDAPCLWLDNDNGNERRVEISGSTLRDDALWRDYGHPRPRQVIARGFPNDEIISRVEGLLGHAASGTNVYWGRFHGAPVELERLSDNRVHIDADMAFDRWVNADDNYDVDVDLVVTCSDGQISVEFENFETDLDFKWYKFLPLRWSYLFTSTSEHLQIDMVSDNLQSFRNGCPAITVENNGDIIFTETVQRVSADPRNETDVDDCAFSSTLNAFVVTTRGSRSENGEWDPGSVALVDLDEGVHDASLDVSAYEDEANRQFSSVQVIDDTLYLAEQRIPATGENATTAISKWSLSTGEKLGDVMLPEVAAVRDFAVSSSGDIFVVEEGATSRIFKVTGSRVSEFETDANRHFPIISSISVDDRGAVMMTGYDANHALVFDQDGALLRRQILDSRGVARAVRHESGTTFVSDGRRGALTAIDENGIATDIHLDSPIVDAFCLSNEAEFALVPFTEQGGFGVYPIGKTPANKKE